RAAPPGRLRVVSSPPGAMVVVAGRPVGRAPLEVRVPAEAAVVLWAVQDGYQSRNVTARAGPPAGRVLSVEIRLAPLRAAQQRRPFVDALRDGTPRARPGAARALIQALGVDAVVVAQLGPAERPRLSVYGAAPRFPGPLPLDLDLVLAAPPVAE